MQFAIAPEKLAAFLPSALAVVDEAIAAVKTAYAERDQAISELTRHHNDVELIKVANDNRSVFTDEDIQNTVADVIDAGFCPPELATKFASDLKSDPKIALATVRRIANLSASAPTTGTGVRKRAFSSLREDVATNGNSEGLTPEEIAAARRLRAEGA